MVGNGLYRKGLKIPGKNHQNNAISRDSCYAIRGFSTVMGIYRGRWFYYIERRWNCKVPKKMGYNLWIANFFAVDAVDVQVSFFWEPLIIQISLRPLRLNKKT